jgi:LPS O-antigen subunit length determinant protein (WzzB/FepE family)
VHKKGVLIMSRFAWMLILAVLYAAQGCEQKPADRTPGKVTSEDVRRDAGQAVNTAVEYSQQAKDDFQKKLDTQLNELDAKIADLRDKGHELKDDAKANWDRNMAELETKQEAARAKLTEVGNSSAAAWEDVQKGAQSAWDDLDKAFRDASREF